MLDLSIVIPTCERAALLKDCIESLEHDLRCSYELIVVDGSSRDATQQVIEDVQLRLGDKLKPIRETKREGFAKGTNKGFRAARGRFMMWLNDDVRPTAGSIDRAVEQIAAASGDVAFLAMFHKWQSPRNIAYETVHNGETYRLCHVRGTLYANFAIGRRETFEQLGYFDERYFAGAADPDLSLKAWHAGMRIEPAHNVFIDHDEHEDERRAADNPRRAKDNEALFAKWDLPPKANFNDFNPQSPCTLRGLREPVAQAA